MSGSLVFVVDDDLSVRRSIRRLLEGSGYRVRMFDAVRPAQAELAASASKRRRASSSTCGCRAPTGSRSSSHCRS
jgi:FixJ family two-component response regulator